MGLRLFGRSSCNCSGTCQTVQSVSQPLPNPNPSRFKITHHEQIGDYLIITAEYPDCKNYEGKKIMLYKEKWQEISKLKELDPHFCDKCISPIARFEPTERGLIMARVLAHYIGSEPMDGE